MISEEQPEPRSRFWAWAIPLSALLHALLVPLALWVFAPHLLLVFSGRLEPERVVASTSIRFEKRPVPNRSSSPAQPAAGQVAPQPQPRPRIRQPAAVLEAVPTPEPTPSPRPSATPQARRQPSTPLQAQIASQQQAFEREVADLRRRNAPESIATIAPQAPAAFHRSAFDVPGKSSRDVAQAILVPLQHWKAGDMTCYYTRYAAQFSNGATEAGIVPWPVCYPRNDDRFVEFPYPGVLLPIPYPQPGYVLPPGTYLSEFLKRIYSSTQIPETH